MPGKYIPTEEEINKLKEMASEGLTLTNMSEYINHTRECVNRILTSLNKQIKQYFRSRNLVNFKMEVSDENQANGSELSD